MSDQNIIIAMQKHMQSFALAKGVDAALEGFAFTPSETKTYLSDWFLPATTQSPSMGARHTRYTGIYQIDVNAPAGSNVVALRTLANEVAEHFKRGTSLVYGGQVTLITRAPTVGPLLPSGGRMMRPVSIRYQSDVITN